MYVRRVCGLSISPKYKIVHKYKYAGDFGILEVIVIALAVAMRDIVFLCWPDGIG